MLVSVVIPTRDRWPLLQTTLKSALAQLDVPLEVIVVDDGSRDETPTRLAALGDDRIRVLRNDQSRGVAAARNAGIHAARAPWVAFLDDDDLWSPEKLARQLAAAEEAGAGFAFSGAAFVDETLAVVEVAPPPGPDTLLAGLLRANTIPAGASNVVARTETVRRLGGFDESLSQIADWDLWIRLADAFPAAACAEPLVAYRMHRENMVAMQEAGALEEIDRLAAKHAHLAAREGVQVDRVRYTRWIAWARRRQGRRVAAAKTYLLGALRYRDAGNAARAVGALLAGRGMRTRSTPATERGDVAWLNRYRTGEGRRASS